MKQIKFGHALLVALALVAGFAAPSLAGGVGQIVAVVTQMFGGQVQVTAPTNGQVLKFDGTKWASAADGGGGENLAQTLAIGADANKVAITGLRSLTFDTGLGGITHIQFPTDQNGILQGGTAATGKSIRIRGGDETGLVGNYGEVIVSGCTATSGGNISLGAGNGSVGGGATVTVGQGTATASGDITLAAGSGTSTVASGKIFLTPNTSRLTSGTYNAITCSWSFQDNGTNSSTTVSGFYLNPTINYTGATRTGSYTLFQGDAVETSLPTGTNYLARFRAGAAGTTEKFSILNTGATTITPTAGSTALTLTGGTITASAPPLSATQTWNAGGVTFRGLEFAFTQTASAAGSTLFRLNSGAAGTTDVFQVNKVGGLTINAGGLSASTTEDTIFIYTNSAAAWPIIYLNQDSSSSIQTYQANRASATAANGVQWFASRVRGTISSPSACSSGDNLFMLKAIGASNTGGSSNSSQMTMEVDGAPASARTPGRFVWSTTTTAAELNQRMCLDNGGILKLVTTGVYGGTSSSSDPTAAADWGISRGGAANAVAIGNGAAADSSGTIQFANTGINGLSVNTTAGDSATINAIAGRFRKDTTGTTFTLTNSKITANSIINLTAANAAIDATATSWTVSAGSGTATITFGLAPTANFDMNFVVIN